MEIPKTPVSNKQLKTLLIIVLIIGIVITAALLMRQQTVQLTTTDDGKILTGEVKSHWKLPSFIKAQKNSIEK